MAIGADQPILFSPVATLDGGLAKNLTDLVVSFEVVEQPPRWVFLELAFEDGPCLLKIVLMSALC